MDAPTDGTRFRTCHLCEAMCGVALEVSGDTVVSVRGDAEDPFSQGYLCPKAPALAELHADPDRLRTPLRRKGTDFVEVGWDEALDEAAGRIHAVQTAHGRNAVGAYLGNPTVHNHGAVLFAPMLLRALKTRHRYSATSVDQLPHQLAAYLVLGHQLLLPVPDIDRTRTMVILGANPLASNGSLMTAPDVKRRLRAIRARGGRVVVVDPRRTETAEAADEHHFIRPGSDPLLLLGMLSVVLSERGARLGRLSGFTRGLDAIERLAREFPPERVSARTGIPADTIRRLALSLVDDAPGVVYARLGASVQSFGGLSLWLTLVLNAVTGNLDSPGGYMFSRPAFDPLAAAGLVGVSPGSLGRWKSRVRGLPEANGELPVATLAEDILDAGEDHVRAMVTVAGNPVLSTPHGAKLDRALASLDFMVSVDMYVNETTRHAHIILPPTSALERSHYDIAFNTLAVRNTARWSAPVFAPRPGALHDWQILLGLKSRLDALRGGRGSLRARATNALLGRLGPDGILDLGLRAGPYGLRTLSRGSMSLQRLKKAPHGVDLGALTPCLPERLPRGYIDLAPRPYLDDMDRLRRSLADAEAHPPTADGGLLLIGRRSLRSNNSWMHNLPKLMAGKPRCTLKIHPDDAARRGVLSGATVTVRSRVGAVEAVAEVADDVMPGVVSLPHGFGHGRAGVRLQVATQGTHAGVSINDLTDERVVDELSGNAVLNGVPVTVEIVVARP